MVLEIRAGYNGPIHLVQYDHLSANCLIGCISQALLGCNPSGPTVFGRAVLTIPQECPSHGNGRDEEALGVLMIREDRANPGALLRDRAPGLIRGG